MWLNIFFQYTEDTKHKDKVHKLTLSLLLNVLYTKRSLTIHCLNI